MAQKWEDAPTVTAAAPKWEDAPSATKGAAPKPPLADEPGYYYGQGPLSWFRIKQDPQGRDIPGTQEFAVPEVFRAPIRGVAEIGGKVAEATRLALGGKPGPATETLDPTSKTITGDEAAALSMGAVPSPGMAARTITASPFYAKPRPEAVTARQAGYVLPAIELSDRPALLPSLASGEGAKIKMAQTASSLNQPVTDRLAAKGLGLPEKTHLNADVMQSVRAGAGAKYETVAKALPEITADQEYLSAVDQITPGSREVYKWFGETPKRADIEELVANLKQTPVFSTRAGLDRVKELRSEASANFKKTGAQGRGDPDAWALGTAQRQAADLIDDLIERRVSNAPQYFTDKVQQISDALNSEQQALKAYTDSLASDAGQMTPGQRQTHANAIRRTQENIDNLQAHQAEWQKLATDAQTTDYSKMAGDYRDARKLIAKSYDVEAALNPVTGEVDARKLAARLKVGRPLTDELRTIAEAGLAFPRSTQVSSRFGGVEPYSVFDFWTALAAVGTSHPYLAAVPLSRPVVRRALLSRPVQRWMATPSPGVPPTTFGAPLAAGALEGALVGFPPQ